MTLMPKAGRGFYSGPSEAVQHLPEGLRPDLDGPGEGVVELGDGEEYAADDQRQGRDHKPVRHVALKPEWVGEGHRNHPADHEDYPQQIGYALPDLKQSRPPGVDRIVELRQPTFVEHLLAS